MKSRLKKYLILFSLLIAGLPRNCISASGWWGSEFEDIRFILFNSDLLENKSWWAFVYTSHSYFMDGEMRGNKDEQAISLEWKNKLKLSTPQDSIEAYLFGNMSGSGLAKNPFQIEIDKNQKLKAFINYAKRCESSISLDDPWGSIYTDSLRIQRAKLLNEGLNLIKREKDVFWQKKYAFQLLRLSYYQGEKNVFDKFYNEFYGLGNEKTPLDWWATHYKSMMYERDNNLDSANYLHALVFSNCSNKMFASKKYFSEKQFDSILKLAKNNKEKADIYLIREINNPGKSINGISNIYALSPDHPILPLLLIREVNKIENWIGTYKYNITPVEDHNYYASITKIGKDDYLYLQRFYATVRGMDRIESKNPEFYNLLCANLALLSADINRAKKYLNSVKGSSDDILFQKNVLETILITISEDIHSTGIQNKLADKLDTLINNRFNRFKSQNILHSLFRLLEYNFRIKKMNYLAGLFNYIAEDKLCESCSLYSFEYGLIRYYDKYASNLDIETLLNIYSSKDRNRLEDLLLRPYTHSNFFRELLGTKYLRMGNISKARENWTEIPGEFWNNFYNASKYLDEDPFSMNEYENKTRKYPYYNKKQIADTLYSLDVKQEKSFSDWTLLGNAWFNFSSKGNSWFMLDYEWSSYESDESFKISAFALRKSLTCYKEALKKAKSYEEKAKVTYYLAFFYLIVYEKEDYLQWANEYEKFSNTKFYRSVNCTLSKVINDPQVQKDLFGWDWDFGSKYLK
jgi:hypothetical protein